MMEDDDIVTSTSSSSSNTSNTSNTTSRIVFSPGPVGLQLEADPRYGSRVVRFVDGGPWRPGPARACGRIQPGDWVVKVRVRVHEEEEAEEEEEEAIATSYSEMMQLLQQTHLPRELTVRSFASSVLLDGVGCCLNNNNQKKSSSPEEIALARPLDDKVLQGGRGGGGVSSALLPQPDGTNNIPEEEAHVKESSSSSSFSDDTRSASHVPKMILPPDENNNNDDDDDDNDDDINPQHIDETLAELSESSEEAAQLVGLEATTSPSSPTTTAVSYNDNDDGAHSDDDDDDDDDDGAHDDDDDQQQQQQQQQVTIQHEPCLEESTTRLSSDGTASDIVGTSSSPLLQPESRTIAVDNIITTDGHPDGIFISLSKQPSLPLHHHLWIQQERASSPLLLLLSSSSLSTSPRIRQNPNLWIVPPRNRMFQQTPSKGINKTSTTITMFGTTITTHLDPNKKKKKNCPIDLLVALEPSTALLKLLLRLPQPLPLPQPPAPALAEQCPPSPRPPDNKISPSTRNALSRNAIATPNQSNTFPGMISLPSFLTAATATADTISTAMSTTWAKQPPRFPPTLINSCTTATTETPFYHDGLDERCSLYFLGGTRLLQSQQQKEERVRQEIHEAEDDTMPSTSSTSTAACTIEKRQITRSEQQGIVLEGQQAISCDEKETMHTYYIPTASTSALAKPLQDDDEDRTAGNDKVLVETTALAKDDSSAILPESSSSFRDPKINDQSRNHSFPLEENPFEGPKNTEDDVNKVSVEVAELNKNESDETTPAAPETTAPKELSPEDMMASVESSSTFLLDPSQDAKEAMVKKQNVHANDSTTTLDSDSLTKDRANRAELTMADNDASPEKIIVDSSTSRCSDSENEDKEDSHQFVEAVVEVKNESENATDTPILESSFAKDPVREFLVSGEDIEEEMQPRELFPSTTSSSCEEETASSSSSSSSPSPLLLNPNASLEKQTPSDLLLQKAKSKHQLSLARLRVKKQVQKSKVGEIPQSDALLCQANGPYEDTIETERSRSSSTAVPRPEADLPTSKPMSSTVVPSSPSIDFSQFSQERSIYFEPGPVGIQLEPTTSSNGDPTNKYNKMDCYPAKIVRFVDGGPHDPGQARASGILRPGDFVVRVEAEGIVGTTYYTILHLLQKSWMTRKLTFRSAWDPTSNFGGPSDTLRLVDAAETVAQDTRAISVSSATTSSTIQELVEKPKTMNNEHPHQSRPPRQSPLKDSSPHPYDWTPLPFDWVNKRQPVRPPSSTDKNALEEAYQIEAARLFHEREEKRKQQLAEGARLSPWNFENLMLGAVAITAESVIGCLRKQQRSSKRNGDDGNSDDEEEYEVLSDHQKKE